MENETSFCSMKRARERTLSVALTRLLSVRYAPKHFSVETPQTIVSMEQVMMPQVVSVCGTGSCAFHQRLIGLALHRPHCSPLQSGA